MAGHTGRAGRHTGEGRFLNTGVTIATIDTQPGNMMLMAERDRLIDGYTNLGLPRGIVEAIETKQSTNQ
jgi:hypothetical protein